MNKYNSCEVGVLVIGLSQKQEIQFVNDNYLKHTNVILKTKISKLTFSFIQI